MPRSRARPRGARPAVPAPRDSPVLDAWLIALAVAAACIAFRGVLLYFFGQDDFTGLARARGLVPPVSFPWRWLSGQLYFDVMRAIAGLHPVPYRLMSLAAHAACVVLVYRLCRRFVPGPSAAVGAVFFGTHPALFTALYSISGVGEILAACFGLGSLLLAGQPGRRAWLALPLFAASLLSKETTLLLPLIALAPALRPRAPEASERARAPMVPLAMAVLSLVYLAGFLVRDVFGMRTQLTASAPYALRFDGTMVDNLLTYMGWTVHIALPFVQAFSDAVDRRVFVDGVVLGVVWLIGLGVRDLRARGWREAAALFVLTLLPVLPLAHHTYHYYLYTPLAGAAVAVAALASIGAAWLAPVLGSRAPVTLFAAIGLILTLNGALLIHKIETHPMIYDPDLRSDSTIDRTRIAANAVQDLSAAALPRRTSLWFWSPVSIARQRDAGAAPDIESYWEANVRAALYDGLAIRVFLPDVQSVRFVRRFEPAGDSVRYAVYLPNGHVRVGTPAELDSVLRRDASPPGDSP